MAFGKRNHVKVDPTAYSLMLLGEPKIGKTTVIMEVLEKLVGIDGFMFVELGRERGADAIEGIPYINCPEWSADYDELDNSIGWEDLVEDICDNKMEEYKDLRVLVLDTYDQYITIAEDEALALWNRKNPDKRADSLNGSWNGFGGGSKKAIELIFNEIDKLEAVGVKVWYIGHVKNKSVTDVASGETYEVLTSDQQQNYFNALKKNLHFLGLAYIDRDIVKEKTGRKNIVTKKDEMKSVVKGEARKIKFRDDNFCVDSGSRFKEIVPEVDLDADQFIKAITDAIKAEQSKSGKSFEQSEAEQKAAEEKRMKEIAEAEEKNKAAKEVKEVVDKILDYIKDNKADLSKVKPILAKCKDYGVKSPAELTNLEDALEVAKLIEG